MGDTGPREVIAIDTLRPPVGSRANRALDALLAAALAALAVTILTVDPESSGGATGPSLAVAVAACASIGARRRYPMAVLATVVSARLFVTWDAGDDLALMPAATVALYTVARHGERRTALFVASAAAVLMGTLSASLGDEPFLIELLGEAAQGLLPIALADGLRTRADRVRDLIEAEAGARVQAERLRIARDLHDVVAHGLSIVAVQSGVAAHLLDGDGDRDRDRDRDRAQARESLQVINATSKTALEELRTMVGVLRSTDNDALRPAPTDPNDLGELVARADQAGVVVSVDTTGAFPDDVGDAVVVAVHRIVQEALTNVARHAGPVGAWVRVDHGEHRVVVEVGNAPPAETRPIVPSTGVGLVGMHERAESVGGTVEAGPTSAGGYRVLAVVPYERRGRS